MEECPDKIKYFCSDKCASNRLKKKQKEGRKKINTMEIEKSGVTYKCPECGYKWDWDDTHCPNCGSDEFEEDEIYLGDSWRDENS